MRCQRYILDAGGNPVEEPDLLTWATWFEDKDNRRVELTKIGPVTVSTVFLALDHSFNDSRPPVLWETMVFGGAMNHSIWRYTSREAALSGHKEAVTLVRKIEKAAGN